MLGLGEGRIRGEFDHNAKRNSPKLRKNILLKYMTKY